MSWPGWVWDPGEEEVFDLTWLVHEFLRSAAASAGAWLEKVNSPQLIALAKPGKMLPAIISVLFNAHLCKIKIRGLRMWKLRLLEVVNKWSLNSFSLCS